MNHHPNSPIRAKIGIAGGNPQSGIATALAIGIIAIFLIFVAVGVYGVKNYNVWLAHGITAGMKAVIKGSALPDQEKVEVNRTISRLKQDYLEGEITISELGLILEAISSSPALPIGLIVQFEQSYVVPSGLKEVEKKAAGLHLNRLARGLADGRIDWAVSGELLAPISDPGEDGRQVLRSPEHVSSEEIREVVVIAERFADQAGIAKVKIDIDISGEFLKSIETALGRPLA